MGQGNQDLSHLGTHEIHLLVKFSTKANIFDLQEAEKHNLKLAFLLRLTSQRLAAM